MGKRAQTNYSFIVGVDKPAGMTSHDVVDAVRRIYGERRVGHTGTLDPAATGVLVVCVGPAARLDRFLTGHDKTYEFTCIFGTQTTTDDAEGELVATEPVPSRVFDESYARQALSWMLGPSKQLPPAYSAIKVGGKTAHEEARAGRHLDLQPRSVVVRALELLSIEADDPACPAWRLRAHVSAGTYIRSLARDLGASVGTCAHVGQLRRVKAGLLEVEECVGLETLASDPFRYQLDPMKLLNVRFLFADEAQARKVASGAALNPRGIELFAYDARKTGELSYCACTSALTCDHTPLAPGEMLGIIVDNRLAAIYAFDEMSGLLKSECGFSIGVARGGTM